MASSFSSTVFIGDMVLMSLSLLYFITPWRSIYLCAFHFPEEELLSYDDCRLKFTTEYDRINPATIEEGINEYLEFVNDARKEEDNANLNNSAELLGEHFDSNFVIKEISKIPSIFGRRNNVARRFDEDKIRPKNLRGEEIELYVPPSRKDSGLKNSQSQKVYVQKR